MINKLFWDSVNTQVGHLILWERQITVSNCISETLCLCHTYIFNHETKPFR